MHIAYNKFEQLVVCVSAGNDSMFVIQQGNTSHLSLLLVSMKLLKSFSVSLRMIQLS